MHYAEVAVDAPAGRSTFSYTVPEGLDARIGAFVWVPFGSRLVRGVIVSVSSNPIDQATKAISSISEQPPLTDAQLELAHWMAHHYLCSIYAACALFAPPASGRRPRASLSLALGIDLQGIEFSSSEREIVSRLKGRAGITEHAARSSLSASAFRRALNSLVDRGIVVRDESPRPIAVKPLTETFVVLKREAELSAPTVLTGARRQRQIYECLRTLGRPAGYGELRSLCGADRTSLRALETKGLVETFERRVWRTPLGRLTGQEDVCLDLTPRQAAALSRIQEGMDSGAFARYLLFGVTGSGKTELYLRAVEHAVRLGRRAICLVPEIALTAQTVERFMARFPGRVALLHSALRPGERADEWERIHTGNCDVVVGPRSALFAPVQNLGLIVLDEEHERTYKQDDAEPRYHARTVATRMAQTSGSTIILGSATPDVETFHEAEHHDVHLLELPQRVVGTADLPKVDVVDMSAELRAGNYGLFSQSLRDLMTSRLAGGEQVFLLLNRRGTATMMQCRKCGQVVICPRCSVSLAYHSARERLVCHRCGYSSRVPSRCPRCSSTRLHFLGVGTQGVVEEVHRLFPAARVLRWDSDVPSGVRSDGSLTTAVRRGEVDVVVGTQMIAKGHDFPNVTLVGVVSTDVGLNIPDYKAGERVFQLLCQAAGRAGRGARPGSVVFQTYNPDHYVIQAASRQDYRGFYRSEIAYREEHSYPPFSRLVRITYANVNEQRARQEAERVTQDLSRRAASGDTKVFGPVPAYVWRLRGHYRLQTTLRGSDPSALLEGYYLPRGWTIDVDPGGVA